MKYVKDLINIKSFKNIKLITQNTGLTRRVSWPNIAQTDNIEEWLLGGDVIFLTGIGLDNTENFLTSIVKQAVDCNASCLVVLLNDKYIKEILQRTINYAVENDFPVFTAPWETKISNIIMEICMLLSDDLRNQSIVNELVESILFCNIDTNKEKIKNKLKKYNLDKCNQVAVMHIENAFDTKDLNEQKLDSIRYCICARINTELKNYFEQVLCITIDNEIIMLFDSDSKSSSKTRQAFEKLISIVTDLFKNAEVKIGVGGFINKWENISSSYKEAKKVLTVITKGNVQFYDNLGIFQLFDDVDTQKLVEYIENNIGPLINYDKNNGQELTKTLKVYLENNSNLVKSAEKLFIHRNTLVKRIEKTEDILNISLRDAQVRNICYVCLKMLEYINPDDISADNTRH